jgi:hypothetical protein
MHQIYRRNIRSITNVENLIVIHSLLIINSTNNVTIILHQFPIPTKSHPSSLHPPPIYPTTTTKNQNPISHQAPSPYFNHRKPIPVKSIHHYSYFLNLSNQNYISNIPSMTNKSTMTSPQNTISLIPNIHPKTHNQNLSQHLQNSSHYLLNNHKIMIHTKKKK